MRGFPLSNPASQQDASKSPQTDRGLLNHLSSTHSVLIFVVLLVILTVSLQPITDPDFWWHLKTGEYIAATHAIPHTDIFSNSRAGSEWVTHEWLSEVIIYSIFKALGYGGLTVAFSILTTVSFWIVYRTFSKQGIHPFIVGLALLLGAVTTMPTWGVRPQIFTLLFASIFISVLTGYPIRNSPHKIWWLVPLTVFWVNLHAGFAFGIVLIVITICGIFLDWWLLRENSFQVAWRQIRTLSLLLIACTAAVCLNPNGPRLYSYPFETLSSPAMMQYIKEWRSPDFHNPQFQALALLLLLTFSLMALSNKRVRPSELLLLIATAWATLRSARNVSFFALVATPMLAEHSWAYLTNHQWGRRLIAASKQKLGKNTASQTVLNLSLLVLVLIIVAVGARQAIADQPATEAREFPAAAADFILTKRPPQPIYNEYTWGGYLIWRLYPEYRVFIDGRADVYGDALVEEWVNIHDGKPRWRDSLDRHGIRTVIVKPEVALASLLRQDNSWQNVFEDKQAVIFVR